MKKALLLTLSLLSALLFSACTKIDTAQIYGEWYWAWNEIPNLSVDGSVTYIFNQDNTLKIVTYDVFSNKDYTDDYTYKLDSEQKTLTFFNSDGSTYNHFKIESFNSSVIKLRYIVPTDMVEIITLKKQAD
ncbi:MAG: hypothetical protein PHD11_08565 [Bacteroidales bacterium]|nr:hypothetical protein [Bacteroidales bacterium]MDD4670294.1 hypothetical protein [Bacteroidales bacterium]